MLQKTPSLFVFNDVEEDSFLTEVVVLHCQTYFHTTFSEKGQTEEYVIIITFLRSVLLKVGGGNDGGVIEVT